FSQTPSLSPSATQGPGLTPTPTLTQAATAVPSATPVITVSPTSATSGLPTATANPYRGAPAPLQVSAAPNPAHGPILYFAVKLAGNADTIHFRIYTKAMTLVLAHQVSGSFQGGWNRVAMPLGNQLLPSGLYYVVVQGGLGSLTESGLAKIGRFVYLQ
ncbi:MAG TPA: hypothetical protein VNZ54_07975, partial [bacterium]|nr:hypothetical protein [bacterium]